MPTKHSPSIHQSDRVKVRQNLTSDDPYTVTHDKKSEKQNDLIMHGLLDLALMSKSGKSTMRLIYSPKQPNAELWQHLWN